MQWKWGSILALFLGVDGLGLWAGFSPRPSGPNDFALRLDPLRAAGFTGLRAQSPNSRDAGAKDECLQKGGLRSLRLRGGNDEEEDGANFNSLLKRADEKEKDEFAHFNWERLAMDEKTRTKHDREQEEFMEGREWIENLTMTDRQGFEYSDAQYKRTGDRFGMIAAKALRVMEAQALGESVDMTELDKLKGLEGAGDPVKFVKLLLDMEEALENPVLARDKLDKRFKLAAGERLDPSERNYALDEEDMKRRVEELKKLEIVEIAGTKYNISVGPEALKAQFGLYEVPVAKAQDFANAQSENLPTADTASEAWDMFKGKNIIGLDYICLRHRRWATEIELFIGSRGRIMVRPNEKHQPLPIMEDGTYMPWESLTVHFNCEHIFAHLRNNSVSGWLEAKGGADAYHIDGGGCEPSLPSGAEPVELEQLRSEEGWVPSQDRWTDFDLFNTSYVRPDLNGDPQYDTAMPTKKGRWRVKTHANYIRLTQQKYLCEIVLTPEGAFFFGAHIPWGDDEEPRALRLEYGLGGCVDGSTVCYALANEQAREMLGLVSELDVCPVESTGCQKLLDWTKLYGWHDLEGRLFNRGQEPLDVFHELMHEWLEYRDEVRKEQDDSDIECVEDDEIYHLRNRKVQLQDFCQEEGENEGFPGKVVDLTTGQVIWRLDQELSYYEPWARELLQLKRKGEQVEILDRSLGQVIAKFKEPAY